MIFFYVKFAFFAILKTPSSVKNCHEVKKIEHYLSCPEVFLAVSFFLCGNETFDSVDATVDFFGSSVSTSRSGISCSSSEAEHWTCRLLPLSCTEVFVAVAFFLCGNGGIENLGSLDAALDFFGTPWSSSEEDDLFLFGFEAPPVPP